MYMIPEEAAAVCADQQKDLSYTTDMKCTITAKYEGWVNLQAYSQCINTYA